MKAIVILNLLFSFLNAFSQNAPFVVKRINQPLINKIQNINDQGLIVWEDEEFIVSNNCLGEFGGAIIFREKKTNDEYVCKAQCAKMINKLNGKYYVTVTNYHGNLFSEIIEIENPKSLEKKSSQKSIQDYSSQGSKILLNINDFDILLSFKYNDELFHIITNDYKAFLIKIENNQYEILNVLSDQNGLYMMSPKIQTIAENHFIIFDDDEKDAGFTEVFENQITINTYKVK
ncbi:MAG: hypothetical protein U0X58_00935 [Flavobacteriaceae bacterium]